MQNSTPMHLNSINRLYADNDMNTYNPQLPEFPEQASEFTYIFLARLTEPVYASGTTVYPAIPVAYKWNKVIPSNPDATNNAAVAPYVMKWLETGESQEGHAVAYPCQKQLDLRNMIETIPSSQTPITKVVYIKCHATESGMHYVIFDPANTREFWARITGYTAIPFNQGDLHLSNLPSQWWYGFEEVTKTSYGYTRTSSGAPYAWAVGWKTFDGARKSTDVAGADATNFLTARVAFNSIENMNRDAAIDAAGSGSPASSAVSTTIGSGQRIGNVDHQLPEPNVVNGVFGAAHHHSIDPYPANTYYENIWTAIGLTPWYIQPCPVNCIVKMEEVTFIDNCEGELVVEYWFQYENYVEFCVYWKMGSTDQNNFTPPFTVPWV